VTLEQVQRRRQAVATIHDIVGAMRAIAAGRIQSAQRALASVRYYERVVLRAIDAVTVGAADLRLPRPAATSTMLLVMTSEQPFCGTFNQNALALAQRRWQELREQGDAYLVIVGHRGMRQLSARHIAADHVESAATSLHGLRNIVKRLAILVDKRFAAGQLSALHAIYNRYRSISEQVPTEEQILPLNLEKVGVSTPPLKGHYDRQLPDSMLFAGCISQYAFISLYRVLAESYTSEQASRLIAMDAATRNTQRMLESLVDLERRERQGEITRQVLELVISRFAGDKPA
jgi:F-type H+-transporting ATPase subunit gamma